MSIPGKGSIGAQQADRVTATLAVLLRLVLQLAPAAAARTGCCPPLTSLLRTPLGRLVSYTTAMVQGPCRRAAVVVLSWCRRRRRVRPGGAPRRHMGVRCAAATSACLRLISRCRRHRRRRRFCCCCSRRRRCFPCMTQY